MRISILSVCALAILVGANAQGDGSGVGATCRINSEQVGSCINIHKTECKGGKTHRNFCPGPYEVQCCVRDDPPNAPACQISANEKGFCENIDEVICAGGMFHRGFCPGDENIRCCVKFKETTFQGIMKNVDEPNSGGAQESRVAPIIIGSLVGVTAFCVVAIVIYKRRSSDKKEVTELSYVAEEQL